MIHHAVKQKKTDVKYIQKALVQNLLQFLSQKIIFNAIKYVVLKQIFKKNVLGMHFTRPRGHDKPGWETFTRSKVSPGTRCLGGGKIKCYTGTNQVPVVHFRCNSRLKKWISNASAWNMCHKESAGNSLLSV